MSHKKLFGTDGVRGTTERGKPDAITPEMAFGLARAAVDVMYPSRRVVVGRDTRPSGVRLSEAVIAGALSAGAHVIDLGVAPTPVVGWSTKRIPESLGVVVTASHNPASDNGLKFLTYAGQKTTTDEQDTIEDVYWRDLERTQTNASTGEHVTDDEMKHDYVKSILDRLRHVYGDRPLHDSLFLIDTAYGAARGMTQQIFSQLGAHIVSVDSAKHGVINLGCGANDLTAVRRRLSASFDDFNVHGFVGAIANDGDADRVIGATMVDGGPVAITGNHMMYFLAQGEPGIVGTDYTNSGLVEQLQREAIAFEYCPNGDAHVTQKLQDKQAAGLDWHRGGEFTGHLIDTNHLKSGDGVFMAAWFACEVVKRGMTFADVHQQLPLWFELLENVRLEPEHLAIVKDPRLIEYVDKMKQDLQGSARLHVRPSGTEPLLRIWAESPEEEIVREAITRIGAKARQLAGI